MRAPSTNPPSPPDLLAANLALLRARHPALAARADAFPDRKALRIFKARDGGVAFGLQEGRGVRPLTDPVGPLERLRVQLDRHTPQLRDFTRPILLVGLYPGSELLYLFDLAEQDRTPHCSQPIWVCLDSPACLLGFLTCWDARRLLEAPRVAWFWADQMPAQVAWLKDNPAFPHVFTLISGASDQVLNSILPPLARLVEERDAETARLKAENDAYYDSLTDEQLAAVISQQSSPLHLPPSTLHPPPSTSSTDHRSPITDHSLPRRPRLLMPTCAWSTFIRHSTRDTCAAFEALGWEARILNVDAMLTPYYLVHSIHEFKPDVFLFIDHLRYEAEDVYPRNMMFVTWIQDEMDHIHCAEAGRKLAEYAAARKRDLVIGYADQRLAKQFGYPADRLVPLKIPADPRIFHPVELTPEDRTKYTCDLAFVTNVSMPTERIIQERIAPRVEPLGISRDTCRKIHDELWALYRSGQTLADRPKFLDWLMQYPEFASAYRGPDTPDAAPADGALKQTQEELVRLFYWRLNDTIYRHVVLEWAADFSEGKSDQLSVIGDQLENHALSSTDHSPSLPTDHRRVSPESDGGGSPTCLAGVGRRRITDHSLSPPASPERPRGLGAGTFHLPPSTSHPPFRLHLYGHGWEDHPRFAKYARGPLEHGPELNKAYQAARWSLHLNITSGMHQRLWEILAAGGHPLMRQNSGQPVPDPLRLAVQRRLSRQLLEGKDLNLVLDGALKQDSDWPPEEREHLADWVFQVALSLAKKQDKEPGQESLQLEIKVVEAIEAQLTGNPALVIPDYDACCFADRKSFTERILGQSWPE